MTEFAMTITVSGSLLYGYNLGGGERPWQIVEVDRSGALTVAWYNPAAVADFAEQAENHLLAGTAVERYSWDKNPSYVLGAHITTAFYDIPIELDLLGLERRRVAERWDTRLAAAIRCLGITPRMSQPRWLLTSSE